MIRFAYECYADEDIVLTLRDHCGLPIRKRHSGGQGQVVNDVLKTDQADVGMVDEDPTSTHHPLRDAMRVDHRTNELEFRRAKGKHLIVLKPELEDCFFQAMNQVGLQVTMAANPKQLQDLLNVPNHPSHEKFRQHLRDLHAASKTRQLDTFIVTIERLVRRLTTHK